MDHHDDVFEHFLQWKHAGGVPLDVFVSDSIQIGGLHGSRSHAPMVAIAPCERDGEEDVTFLTDRDRFEAFIARLRVAADSAFGSERGPSELAVVPHDRE